MSSYDINHFYCDDKEISSTVKIGLLVFYPFIMFIGFVWKLLDNSYRVYSQRTEKNDQLVHCKHGGFRLYVLINIHPSRPSGDGGEQVHYRFGVEQAARILHKRLPFCLRTEHFLDRH